MLRVQVSRRPHWRGILATGKRGSTKPAGSTWNIWDGDGSNLLSSHLPAAGSLVVCDGVDALGAAREESGLFSSTHVGDGKKSDKQREQHQQAENPSQQAHEGNPGTVCPAYPSLIGNCGVVLVAILRNGRSWLTGAVDRMSAPSRWVTGMIHSFPDERYTPQPQERNGVERPGNRERARGWQPRQVPLPSDQDEDLLASVVKYRLVEVAGCDRAEQHGR